MKNIYNKLYWWVIVCLAVFPDVGTYGNVQVANLKQDLELISRELAGLRSEVELLRRENAQLRVVVDSVSKKSNSNQGLSSTQLIQINSRLSSLEKRVQENATSQEKIQSNVNQQFQELINQMNRGFERISNSAVPTAPLKFMSERV